MKEHNKLCNEAVAKFIVATRKANELGQKNKALVADVLQKAANMPADDAKAYAAEWDKLYVAGFEAARARAAAIAGASGEAAAEMDARAGVMGLLALASHASSRGEHAAAEGYIRAVAENVLP